MRKLRHMQEAGIYEGGWILFNLQGLQLVSGDLLCAVF